MKFLQPILLIAATVALYWPSLHYAPFFDDTNFFELGVLQQIFLNGASFAPRWLPYFITAWADLLFEDPLFAQRCINVALHMATAFVLHGLIRQVADHVAPHPNNRRAALAATLLFLLHPLAVYAVGYLIQRTILMATLFGLLTLSTYFDALVTRKKAYFFFSAIFYLLSCFSKEHAVLIPAAALALTPLAVPLNRQVWRMVALPCALYLPIGVLVVLMFKGLIGAVIEPFAAPLVHLQVGESGALHVWALSVMTQCALFFKYLGLMLVPYPGWMSIDMRVPFAASFWETKYWFAVIALLGYATLASLVVLRGGRIGLIGYALLAPLLLFAVEFSSVRIQEPFVLYRTYLWITPLFLAIPVATQMLPDRFFWPAFLALALAFALASSDRLRSFSSPFALWDDAVKKLPDARALGAARTYTNRGGLRMKRGDVVGAIADFTSALRSDPGYKDALKGRVFAYMKQGKHDVALAEAAEMIRLHPDEGDVYIARGHVYKDLGDMARANLDFVRGCKSMGRPELCLALFVKDEPRGNPASRRSAD